MDDVGQVGRCAQPCLFTVWVVSARRAKCCKLCQQSPSCLPPQALAFIYDPAIVANLFNGVQERFGNRNGGYTIIKTNPELRRGDSTEMATIELCSAVEAKVESA